MTLRVLSLKNQYVVAEALEACVGRARAVPRGRTSLTVAKRRVSWSTSNLKLASVAMLSLELLQAWGSVACDYIFSSNPDIPHQT